VKRGLAERTVCEDGLEIFDKRTHSDCSCRGIVFHGDSVVAAAFEPFDDCCCVDNDDRLVNASFKIDGSLIMAFTHSGSLRVSTRRRMDSEQALWAKGQLAGKQLKPGWTYAFEAVYADNTVVISYPFEGLVLLDAWSPDGYNLAPSDRLDLAISLGVMCAPSVLCMLSETDNLLRGTDFEGWVLDSRHKLVLRSYKEAHMKIAMLHPVSVWYEIRMGGDGSSCDRLPGHARAEKQAMISALQRGFKVKFLAWYDSLEFEFDASATWENLFFRHDYREAVYRMERNDGWSYTGMSSRDRADAFFRLRDGEHVFEDCYFFNDGFLMMHNSGLRFNWGLVTDNNIPKFFQLNGGNGLLYAKDKWLSIFHGIDVKSFSMFYIRRPVVDSSSVVYSGWRVVDTSLLLNYRSCLANLRVRVLDSMRPSDYGTMLYYSPSVNFSQTHAKGWMRNGVRKEADPLIFQIGLNCLECIFSHIPIYVLVDCVFVCKAWYALINADAELMASVRACGSPGKAECRGYDDDDCSDDFDDSRTCYHGYGSN
jgi:hypothetical protein